MDLKGKNSLYCFHHINCFQFVFFCNLLESSVTMSKLSRSTQDSPEPVTPLNQSVMQVLLS